MPMRPPVHRPAYLPPPTPKVPFAREPGSPASRAYDSAWRRVRQAVLGREPLCRSCAKDGRVTPATEVHHVRSIREAPEQRLDPANLEPICKPCHLSRSGRDGARAAARGR